MTIIYMNGKMAKFSNNYYNKNTKFKQKPQKSLLKPTSPISSTEW